jgi:hypothetical protein
VRRRDREIIDIGECAPLDAVIERLQTLHRNLSEDAEPLVKVHGCDDFGWRLTVSYFREATTEEAELEAKYAFL